MYVESKTRRKYLQCRKEGKVDALVLQSVGDSLEIPFLKKDGYGMDLDWIQWKVTKNIIDWDGEKESKKKDTRVKRNFETRDYAMSSLSLLSSIQFRGCRHRQRWILGR